MIFLIEVSFEWVKISWVVVFVLHIMTDLVTDRHCSLCVNELPCENEGNEKNLNKVAKNED